jgi:Ca2+-transporting ATPase
MISGSKVIEGVGKYVVVAVRTKSLHGRQIMMGMFGMSALTKPELNILISAALRTDTEDTPLQIKLNILAAFIANIGSIIGLALFTALGIKFFVELGAQQSSRYG